MRDMIEMAWAAGFFDGEGSTVCGTKANSTVYLQMSVVQVDRRPLERFVCAVGVGRIGNPRPARSGEQWERQPIYTWNAYGPNALLAYDRLRPYLSEPKKEQGDSAVSSYRARPLLRGEKGVDGKFSQCRNGHPYDETSAPSNGKAKYRCRICRLAASRRYEERKRAKHVPCHP